MLRRCYDSKNNMFPSYGAIGCYVVDEWHYFSNFVNDMEQKENIDKIKNKNSVGWQLDKDYICNIKGTEPHYYSNETTCIITEADNIKERNQRHGNPSENQKIKVMQFDTKGNYITSWDSIIAAGKSIDGEKANTSWLIKCCKGDANTYKGYCWIYESDFIGFDEVKQMILNRINNVRKRDKIYRKTIQQIDIDGNIIREDIVENIADILGICFSRGFSCG